MLSYGQSDMPANSALEKIDEANKKALNKPLEAYTLATQALDLSYEYDDKLAEASAYNTLGTLYFNAENYRKAIDYFKKATAIYETYDDPKNKEYALKYLAKSYEALGLASQSSSYYEQAEQNSASEASKSDYRIQNSKQKKFQGKKKEAINDLENELKNSALSKEAKIDIYLELGDLYLEEKDTVRGKLNIQEALQESQTITDSSIALSWSTLNYVNDIYEKNGFEEDNILVQEKALEQAKSSLNVDLEQAANFNIGANFIETNPKKAAGYLEQSAKLSAQKPEKKIDHIKSVEKLSEAYERSGEYVKALETYKQYIQLVDSLKESEIESKLKTEMLSVKYEIQEGKIRELELKQISREKDLRQQKNTIFGLIAGLSLLALLSFFLYRNIREKQRSNDRIQLASLRSQMNPHFIFNSLNSVNGFIAKNEEVKANRYLSDFSKLMRSVLNNSNKSSISLREELDSLEIYLSLEHSRFEEVFDYEIQMSPSIVSEETWIPPMLIQPYLENAIWHGLRYKKEKGFLKLSFDMDDTNLLVLIQDNGIGRKASEALKTKHQKDHKSSGIKNTKERIRLLNGLHGSNLSVQIKDLEEKEESGTEVLLKLPIIDYSYA